MSADLVTQFLNIISFLGVIVFAISGALIAADKNFDVLGFLLIGTVTGVGGGTLRDLLLGITPVFWVHDSAVLISCLVATVATYFAAHKIKQRQRWILWMDAAGLAAFAVMGCQVAMTQDVPLLTVVVMGVMSATFGGVMRDVLCADTLMLMRAELYISCALLGALLYVGLRQTSLPTELCALCAFFGAFLLRLGAIHFGWKLPKYR